MSLLPSWSAELNIKPELLEQYSGVWAVEQYAFQSLVSRYSGLNLHAHIEAMKQADPTASQLKNAGDSGRAYELRDNIAVIPINGVLTKYGSSLSGRGSTKSIARAVRTAMSDNDVRGIALIIDSPGGQSAGLKDLTDRIASYRGTKPIYAYVEDLSASAAYWVASQTDKVFANNTTALIGSIGTYLVVTDYSGSAAQMGIKVHVVKAGEYKGAGEPGTNITPEQLANWQRLVDSVNQEFVADVARGRRMTLETATGLADGRVHPAKVAQELGLIDGIATIDEFFAQLSSVAVATKTPVVKGKRTMSVENDSITTVDLIKQIKAACPGASSEFVLSQVESGATVTEALGAYAKVLAEQVAAQQAQLAEQAEAHAKAVEEAKAEAAASAAANAGCKPLSATSEESVNYSGDPISDFNAKVVENMKSGLTRDQAIQRAAKQNPSLHVAFVLATNSGAKQQRLVREKYGV